MATSGFWYLFFTKFDKFLNYSLICELTGNNLFNKTIKIVFQASTFFLLTMAFCQIFTKVFSQWHLYYGMSFVALTAVNALLASDIPNMMKLAKIELRKLITKTEDWMTSAGKNTTEETCHQNIRLNCWIYYAQNQKIVILQPSYQFCFLEKGKTQYIFRIHFSLQSKFVFKICVQENIFFRFAYQIC